MTPWWNRGGFHTAARTSCLCGLKVKLRFQHSSWGLLQAKGEKIEKHSQWLKIFAHTAERMLMCLAPGVNLLDAGSWTPWFGPAPDGACEAFELAPVSQRGQKLRFHLKATNANSFKAVQVAQAPGSEASAAIVKVSAVRTWWPCTSLHVTGTHCRGRLSNTDDTSHGVCFPILWSYFLSRERFLGQRNWEQDACNECYTYNVQMRCMAVINVASQAKTIC